MEYYKLSLFPCYLTQGVWGLMERGYSWFVTDALSVVYYKRDVLKEYKRTNFLIIELKVDKAKKEADLIIKSDDGIKVRTIYKQHYDFTDATENQKLYLTDDVLMCWDEY